MLQVPLLVSPFTVTMILRDHNMNIMLILGRNEDTADSNTDLVFEYEEPDSGCIVQK